MRMVFMAYLTVAYLTGSMNAVDFYCKAFNANQEIVSNTPIMKPFMHTQKLLLTIKQFWQSEKIALWHGFYKRQQYAVLVDLR